MLCSDCIQITISEVFFSRKILFERNDKQKSNITNVNGSKFLSKTISHKTKLNIIQCIYTLYILHILTISCNECQRLEKVN